MRRETRFDSAAARRTVSGSNSPQAFFQSLQALGVTPEQFRSDFLAALKQVQSGQTNSNSAVASPLTGLAVDANA